MSTAKECIFSILILNCIGTIRGRQPCPRTETGGNLGTIWRQCDLKSVLKNNLPKNFIFHKLLILNNKLVRLAGIEPTTLGFGGQYSIH